MIKQLEIKEEIVITEATEETVLTDPEVISYLYAQLKKVEESATDTRRLLNQPVIMDLNVPEDHVRAWVMVSDLLTVVHHCQYRLADKHPYADVTNFLFGEIQKRVEETNMFIEDKVVLEVYEINEYLATHGLSDIPNPENIVNIQPIYTGFEPEDFINGQGIEKLSKELREVRALAYKLHGQIMRNIDDADDNERQICNKMVVCEKLDELDSAIIDLQKIVDTKGLIIETKNIATNANRIIDDLNTIFLSVGLRVDKGDTEDKPAPQKVDEESLPPTTGSKEKIDTSWFKVVSPLVFNNDVWENSHAMGGLRMAAKKTLAVIEAALVEASAKSFEDEADIVKNKIYVMDLEVLSRCVDGIIVEIDSFNCNRLTLMAKTQYFNNNMVLLFGYTD